MEFDTAVARTLRPDEDEEQAPFEFTIVERDQETDAVVKKVVCHAYEPGEGQIVVLLADVMGRRSTSEAKVAGIIDFFTDVLDDESSAYIVGRLLDRRDPFGLDDISPIANHLIEEWTGRPTKPPTDYLPSRKAGGRNSTQRTPRSTSSGSRRTAS